MAKILLLNPPGDKTYLRDSYCSKVSKAAYLTPPMDLLAISGILSGRHELAVTDAMAERLSFEKAFGRIAEWQPGYIVSLFGQASYDNDLRFFDQIKSRMPGIKLIVSGDAGFDDTERLVRENRSIDAVLLDYTSRQWLPYLAGAPDGARDVAFFANGKYHCRRSEQAAEYSIGMPLYHLFPYARYRMPFALELPYAGVVTDFGCPFGCDFCLIGQLPHKLRPMPEVIAELRRLKEMGIKYFSFGDQTFGTDTARTGRLLTEMIANKIDLPWACFTRADLVTEGGLRLMKRAGCELLMMGAESGDQEMLDRYHKNTTLGAVRSAFDLCRKNGIRTVATFIVGLPGETAVSLSKTIGFARALDPDFASFNLPVAKPLTPLRSLAESSGWLVPGTGDQSGKANICSESLSPDLLRNWQRAAIRKFYLRPGYLVKRLRALRSFPELSVSLREAAGLLWGAR